MEIMFLSQFFGKLGARWFEKASSTVNKIREILKITALGIDYKKYAYFEIITPKVNMWWKDGVRDYEPFPKEYYENMHELRKENCRFCIDFVIDSALKLQEFDYDINKILK